jgi:hypothetical protein
MDVMIILTMSNTDLWITAGATIGLAAATLGLIVTGAVAICVARNQLSETNREASVDRTVALHREATTGEVQAAKRRLGALMWATGERLEGRRHYCYQPRWKHFLPPVKGVSEGGAFARYPAGIAGPEGARPLDDLYCILHSFERIRAAQHEATLDDGLFRNLAWDIARWSRVLENITAEDTPRAAGLRALAPIAIDKLSGDDRARFDRDDRFVGDREPSPHEESSRLVRAWREIRAGK